MNNIIKDEKGFVITGAMIAWAIGISALAGGGAYVAHETMQSDNEGRGHSSSQERGHKGGNERGEDKDHSFIPSFDELAGISMGDLSTIEEEGLISMREEEKLARDVYRTMYDIWGVKTFENISYSENRHSLAVKALLDRYGISDPVKNDATGVFTIPEMQELYATLVAQGNESLVDALRVGATIEDLDIYDLNRWVANTDNEDILKVFENLTRGSRNHMRSFNEQLEKNGATYTAQYLTQAEIGTILAGEQERGNHGDGEASEMGSKAHRGEGRGMGNGGQKGMGNGEGKGRNR